MSDELASWIPLEGCFNFRDLGGYRTADGRRLRERQVFRADGLQRLTDADLRLLCDEIGLGAVIDLRSEDEIAEDGRGAIAERTTIHHVPLFEKARTAARQRSADGSGTARQVVPNMGELYFLMLQAARRPIVEVIRLIAASETPIVFHCAAGKDRTGVISSVLLSLLDVPLETIVADYAFSRKNIDRINARLNESTSYQSLMHELPDGAYDADPAQLQSFLARVEAEYGSLLGWAQQAGIDDGERARFRTRLLA